MYSSEKNPGINWKDLILKAIFLVVFLLLLVWLFPKVPNMKPFYSNVFRENIKYMQDAAESYYTTERLPKNIGDSAEMTLQEMINKNLILPFVDENGEECDTYSSYVQVKKNKDDYTLKVNLVCPNESNYVEKTLGCYQYCEDDSCKQELEYQYKKEITANRTSYSCPEGGSLVDGICYIYKTDSYKATETTQKGTYYCPNGGTLSGTTCYVSSTDSYNASVTTGTYYCPYGGTLNGTTCYVSSSSSYASTANYTCLYGGSLSGTTCITTLSGSSYNASVNYTCPAGTVQSGTTCISTTSGSSYNASVTYTCPDGTVQSSPTCKTTITTPGITINATPSTKKTYLSGTYTSKPSGATCSTSTQYVCSSSSNCPGYVTVYTACYKYVTTYSCPTGQGYTKNGTKCIKAGTSSITTTTGKAKYSCPRGGELSGTKCVTKGSSITMSAMKSYYCPRGGELSGTRCITKGSTSSYAATLNRTCPNGGTLSGTRCVISDSYTYTASKNNDKRYCPNGGTLSGTKCIVDKSYTYTASVTQGETVLTCPNGGELKDKLCYTTSISKQYKAKVTTSKVTSYSYKWSTAESLEGWIKTGESRAVTTQVAKN